MIPIYAGDTWTVMDKHRDQRRELVVISADGDVNHPGVIGARVTVKNTATGRRSHVKAATMREYWRRESGNDE